MTFPDWKRLRAHLIAECRVYEPDEEKAERMADDLLAAIRLQWDTGRTDANEEDRA